MEVVVEPGPIMTPMLNLIRNSQSKWLAENPTSEYFGGLSAGLEESKQWVTRVMDVAFATQERNVDKMRWIAVSPRTVAEVIAVALGSPNPLPRYVVATPLFFTMFQLVMLLPDRWVDWVMGWMTN